ncbi:hypothetical protein [Sporosarcina sp. NCCP-2222]|uniref:hypothetical protein n=1 Tax=Sporosarcina sp. NCCP-2222 TaxID=2935073 RepID=UPI0020BFBB9E|nr:hypothetical protein [Sporosarcina sp. NCCP-2222]
MVRKRNRAVRELYEWFGSEFERFRNYTSGSEAESSGSRIIRVVRKRIRAVRELYEWFGSGFERFENYTSGSEADSIKSI